MHGTFRFLGLVSGCVVGCAVARAPGGDHQPAPRATSSAPSPFYTQRLDDGGIPIRAHASVSKRALLEARERLERLLHDAPRLRRNLEARGYELHIIGLEQFASDLPEYRSKRGTTLSNGQLFDWHMIGGHGSETAASYSSCSEGTLLPIVGFKLFGDDTCLHELGHVIDGVALAADVRARIVIEYYASMGAGDWKDTYAASNPSEWFAEVTKYYFRPDRPDLAFYDPNLAKGHYWFCGYDARACGFISDLYNDRIDPGIPKTVTVAPGPGQGDAESLRSRESRVPTRVIVRNRSGQRIRVIWLDFHGQRDTRRPLAEMPSIEPGEESAQFTWATHAFVVIDDSEHALCTFTAPDDDAIVDIAGPCS